MKYTFFLIYISCFLWACNNAKPIAQTPQAQPSIEVLCLANDCKTTDPLNLYEFNGIGFTKIQALSSAGMDSFKLQIPVGAPRFLYIGTESQPKLPVVFSDENMLIKGSCKAFRRSKISNSNYNSQYNEVLQVVRSNKRNMQVKIGEYRKMIKEPAKQKLIKEELAELDRIHLAYLDSVKVQNPFLANIVGLSTMLSFPNKMDQYPNEVEYFVAEFFAQANLSDPVFNDIPYLFESFKEFSQTIASVGLDPQVVNQLIDQNLNRVPDSTKAMRYALGGVLIGLQGKNHPSFLPYAQTFMNKFGTETDAASIQRLKSQLESAKSFIPGGEAPEISMKTPEGETLNLSDLKGKVVLIDFWASWCGPCRRENPNVVKVYDKYKSKGFEILGVSLDRGKEKWLQAIAKDGLGWYHVSDLKGWKNEAAQTYGVRSIPHTVLVDPEGKIIARNLRGPALERKLAEIFD